MSQVVESSKVLTFSDAHRGYLEVPQEWLSILGCYNKSKMQLHVIDGVGFFWEFECFACLNETAFLQGDGWKQFTAYKNLQSGDRVVLDTVANEFRGSKFRIRAQKKNQNGVWVDV